MIKKRLKPILTIFILIGFCTLRSYAQLIVTSLVEDPSRNNKVSSTPPSSNYRIQAVAATTAYSDTLRLPFFEDFSGVIVPIDSIVISSSDQLVKVYSKILNSYADGTSVFIGFNQIPASMTVADTLSQQQWYIQKIATNEFLIYPTSSLSSPKKFYATDIIYTNAYWRPVSNSYGGTIDSLKWETGGNTYINNRFPIDPVSYNVATFDGLLSTGIPYNTTDVHATGYSDNLTSLPIDLQLYTAVDSVYLSFYWQQNGLGDAPETTDYIVVEFKDTSGTWDAALTINGNIAYMDTFQFSLIKIIDPKYFFKDFQFRFRSFGRLSGPFDIWNIDYIYLDKSRNSDPRDFDMTVGNADVSFLKHYTAMPYNQYFANKSNEIGQLKFTTNNVDRDLTTSQTLQTVCYLTTTVNSYNYLYKAAAATHATDNSILTYQDSCSFPSDSLQNQNFPMKVDARFYIGINDTSNILYACNNTFITSTILWDYYAYDDGTPEWGVAANQIGAKVANKFTTNVQDTITDIDIYFTRSTGPDLSGDHILLGVWDNNHKLIHPAQAVQVKYGGFIRYHLNHPAVVGANLDFYVGYQQNFVDVLSIGYDRNYDHSGKIFFNVGSGWTAYDQQAGYYQGSMMIRPVFSKNQFLVTPIIEKEESVADVILYPVPSDNELKIKGRISEVSLYDLTGRKLNSSSFDPYQEEKIIDITALSNGLYIVELKINDTIFVKKIIVQHAN